MKTSADGLALIESFEGLRLEAYQDQRGIWSLGYGHTGLSGGPSRVKQGDTCGQAQADAWLAEDVGSAEACVNTLVKVQMTQNEFDALVSFAYNVGWAALESSTLLREINAGAPAGLVAAQFPRWDHAGAEVSEGLLRRREAEAALFLAA